jgi:HD-like signal output (HDOD) protein
MSANFLSQSERPIDQLIERIEDVAVLPHVVYKVLELSASTDTAATELERTIVVDPGFSTRILALANSAFYGLPKRVTSIREAVAFLGYKQIRQMAMTVGFFDMFVGKNDRESLRRRAWWRHSIDTAICCRWLAGESRKLPQEEAYTCGLLHYIGKPLMDRHVPGGYERVEQLVMTAAYTELEAEHQVFGGDHIEVAIAACTKWRLPESLVAALSYHDVPTPESLNAPGSACVALGSAIACSAVDGPGTILPTWALTMLGFAVDQAEDLQERAVAKIAASRSLQL